MKFAPAGLDLFLAGESQAMLDNAVAVLKGAWGRHCYSDKGEALEAVVGTRLLASKKTIALAESCTGGLIASRITRIPGCSRYFDSACVSYSNASKVRLLSVPDLLLKEKGAVSAEVAAAMAEGIRLKASVDLGLSVTGVAGPEGASPQKPLGLVYIALSDASGVDIERHRLKGERKAVQAAAGQLALDLVRRALELA